MLLSSATVRAAQAAEIGLVGRYTDTLDDEVAAFLADLAAASPAAVAGHLALVRRAAAPTASSSTNPVLPPASLQQTV